METQKQKMKSYIVLCKGQSDERGREADHHRCLTSTSGLLPFWGGWLGFLWLLLFWFAKTRSALPSAQCKQPILQLSQLVWEVRKEAMPKQLQLPASLCCPILWPFSPAFASVSSELVQTGGNREQAVFCTCVIMMKKTDLTFLFPVTNYILPSTSPEKITDFREVLVIWNLKLIWKILTFSNCKIFLSLE